MYLLAASKTFQKQYKSISRRDPKLKLKIDKKLKFLRRDIKHPSLRMHKLSGKDTWSVSVTMSIRMIVGLEKNRVYLLEVGTHDEVY